jgi:hypothetical protein
LQAWRQLPELWDKSSILPVVFVIRSPTPIKSPVQGS